MDLCRPISNIYKDNDLISKINACEVSKFNINKAGSHFKMLQLTNSEVTHCSNTEEQLFFELGIKKEDYGDFFADIAGN